MLEEMAKNIELRMRDLDFPTEWFESAAALSAKVVGATDLSKFRPIACLCTLRKILGYMFLGALPQLEFRTKQTAFVKGSHANMGPHLLLRCGELAREWSLPFCTAQLDLKKAFDHVDHRAALEAMRLQGVPEHAMALIAKVWSLSSIRAKLGTELSDAVPLQRGLPQGAPESPLIFTMVVEMVVRRCEEQWQKRNLGFEIDGRRFYCVCYADDIILLARTPKDLEKMIADIVAEFRSIGLGIGADKTHWTSYPQREAEVLRVEGCTVEWEASLTFVGMEVNLSGSSWGAVRHRIARGNLALRRWMPLLCARWLSVRRKMELLTASVFASAQWGCAVWATTKAMRSALNSWSARVASAVVGYRRKADEGINAWWRRFHRKGHHLIATYDKPLSEHCLSQVHRWAGHIARLDPDHFLASALRSRAVQWWRFKQAHHRCKWSGVHPKRFKAWRWEDQLCRCYGDGYAELVQENTGWWLSAQDRSTWKESEQSFSKLPC